MRAGSNCRSFRFGGTERRYVAYVSTRAQRRMRARKRVPVVTMLHGATGTGERFLAISGWREKADQEGLIAVFPSSRAYLVDEDGNRRRSTRWAAYKLEDEIDERVVPPADDVGFLRRVIGDVVAVNRVNRGRVWLSGFSDGGSMCMRAAMELTRLIRAFGCNAGSVASARARVTRGAPHRPVMFTYGTLDRNLIAAAGVDEIPIDPTDAFELDAVRGLVRLQLLTLRLGPEPDVAERRSDAFDLRFDNAIGQARASEMHFVLLEDVPHEYPNDPNGFSMPDVLWRFFRGRPAL